MTNFWPHHVLAVHKIQPIATDVARSVLCVSVCLSVGHTDLLCKNDRDAVASRGCKEACIRWGSRLDESFRSHEG